MPIHFTEALDVFSALLERFACAALLIGKFFAPRILPIFGKSATSDIALFDSATSKSQKRPKRAALLRVTAY
jgi:hypothetical protein